MCSRRPDAWRKRMVFTRNVLRRPRRFLRGTTDMNQLALSWIHSLACARRTSRPKTPIVYGQDELSGADFKVLRAIRTKLRSSEQTSTGNAYTATITRLS